MAGAIRTWWQNHGPSKRRLVQLYSALLYNAHLKGFAEGEIYQGITKAVCVPGLNCYSCPGAVGACPLGALQNAISASASRPAFYIVGTLLLFGLALGRMICGWACPVGLAQELLFHVPVPKIRKNRVTRILSYLKYVILAVFVILIPAIYAFSRLPFPAFCKFICPAGTAEGAIGLLANPANTEKLGMLGLLFTRKFIILVAVITASMFLFRPFCRFVCPLGAIYGLMTRIAVWGVRVDDKKCINCGACVRECKMDIRHVGDHECIHCGKCINVCPVKAISFASKKRRSKKIAAAAAVILLAGALVYYNFIYSTPKKNTPQPPVQVAGDTPAFAPGSAPGQMFPDFELRCADGSTYRLSDHRGKVVVINIWATWCNPCVKELPYFEKLYNEHTDGVSVIAIHSDLVTDDVQAFLKDFDFNMPVAYTDVKCVTDNLEDSIMLPITIVLDKNGVVTYNKARSVTYDVLELLVAEGAK